MPWKASLLLLPALLFFVLPAHAQLGAPLGRCGPHPADPNWPQNQLPAQPVSLQAHKRTAADMIKLQHAAQELADLSASVPADVNRANQGLLSKDIIDKLRRVEKLSKQLRSDLTR